MSSTKVVKRGYVVIHKSRLTGETMVTAVCGKAEAERLRARVFGRVVSAEGHAYRLAQGTVRVLSDPEAIIRQYA